MEKQQETPKTEDSNFLAMVRESNEKRASAKENQPENNGDENAEKSEERKESKEESKEGQKVEEVDVLEPQGEPEESLTVTVDPLKAHPSKKEKKSKEDNIVGLRNALKTEREKIAELELQLKERDEKLQQTGNVEELNKKLQEATQRIGELEKYEKLLGLKQSKEFKAKYIDGVDNLLNQLKVIAKDYGVGAEVLKTAIATGNRRDLNQLLAKSFDSVAVNDVRPIVLEIQRLLIEKKAAETDPEKVEAELIKSAELNEKKEQELSRTRMQSTVQSGWADILTLYSSDDSGTEVLREIPGNEEHNGRRTQIIKKAATEYGNILGILAKDGLRNISEDTAKALAARFQLAEIAGYLIAENTQQKEELTKIRSENKKLRGYSRPLANGNSPRMGNEPPPKKLEGKQIAEHVFMSAQEKLSSR